MRAQKLLTNGFDW